MSEEQKKAPKLGGDGSSFKGGVPTKGTGTASTNSAENASANLSLKRHVAESLLGPVEWINDESGFCTCPGKDLHSKRNAKKDCQLFLNGKINIHCFHDSCSAHRESVSSEIWESFREQNKTGWNPTPEQKRQWREGKRAREVKRQELEAQKAKDESLKKRARLTLEHILEDPQYSWSKSDCVESSPVDCSRLEFPEWLVLADAIFNPEDVIWMGSKFDSKPSNFKTSSQWQAEKKTLPKSFQLMSPWAFNEGSQSRTKDNAKEMRALIVESDDLGEDSFKLFKWLRVFLRLRAVVSSGGKSYHAWFDVPSESLISELQLVAEELGMDPKVIGGLATRLPGQIRSETGNLQELLYLDSDKSGAVEGNFESLEELLVEDQEQEVEGSEGKIKYYFKDVQSSASEAKFVQNCPYPTDSIIHEFVVNVRKQVESSDSLIIGSVVGMIAALIGRKIWFELDRKKHPNIYALLTADPGDRKSSVMGLSKRMLKEIIGPDAEDHFLSDASSPEALFDEFENNQDKIWMTDEATPILHAWAFSPQGQVIAKRLLSIYDCEGWSETYKKNKTETNKTGRRVIESTSLTMVLGCVFAAIKETKIASQDGLKRRFLNYVSDGPERIITRPKRMEKDVRESLVSMFKTILEFEGEATMSEAAWRLWDDYQHKNRARQKRAESLELKYTLSEEPALVFKMAVIFQVARSVVGNVPWNVISPETLEIAIAHVAGSIEASQAIDAIHQTDEGQEDEDFVFDTINDPDSGFKRLLGTDAILVTKAELTRRFSNRGNKSKITTTDMKKKIIPSLIKKGLCIALEKQGKKKSYLFRDDNVI